jgi:hypothetical protein
MAKLKHSHLKLVSPSDAKGDANARVSLQKDKPILSEFYIHAVLQAARGYQLGLDLGSAKSWGLNRAIFYQAAKSGSIQKRGKKVSSGNDGHFYHAGGMRTSKYKNFGILYPVGREKAYAARDPQGGIRFIIGGKPQTPEMFDRQIKKRFPDFELVWNEAIQMMEMAGLPTLNSASRFHDAVYKRWREQLAQSWSKGESALSSVRTAA